MPKRLTRFVTAVVIAGAPAVSIAVPAFASGHHPAPPGLAGAQRGAQAVIKQDVRHLTALATREAADKRLNSTDQAALASATTGELSALQADQAAVAAATTKAGIHAAVVSAQATMAEAKLDFRVVSAADRVEASDAALNARGAAIAAQESGVSGSTTALDAVLADLAKQTAAADTAAGNAVTTVTGLASAPTAAQVRAARLGANHSLAAAHKANAKAKADAAKAAAMLARLQAGH